MRDAINTLIAFMCAGTSSGLAKLKKLDWSSLLTMNQLQAYLFLFLFLFLLVLCVTQHFAHLSIHSHSKALAFGSLCISHWLPRAWLCSRKRVVLKRERRKEICIPTVSKLNWSDSIDRSSKNWAKRNIDENRTKKSEGSGWKIFQELVWARIECWIKPISKFSKWSPDCENRP